MSVKQISVFLENRPGALCEMTKVLADEAIDMRAFSSVKESPFAMLRNMGNAMTVMASGAARPIHPPMRHGTNRYAKSGCVRHTNEVVISSRRRSES